MHGQPNLNKEDVSLMMMRNIYKQICPMSVFGKLFTRRTFSSASESFGTSLQCKIISHK
jgi:hypothetical protein